MYGQTLALAALSAAGAMAAPQMCACPSNGQLSSAAPDASGSGYASTSTVMSTVEVHHTATVTAMVDSASSSLPVQTITQTETTTCTTTETTTIHHSATNTPSAPVASGSSVRPSAPYYPTGGSGPSGVAQQSGSAGVAQSTGATPSAASASGSGRPSGYSYPVGTGRPTPSGTPLGTAVSSHSAPYPSAYGHSSGFASPSERRHSTPATPLASGVSTPAFSPSAAPYSLPKSSATPAVSVSSASSSGPAGYGAAPSPSAEAVSAEAVSATSSGSASGTFPQKVAVTNQAAFSQGAAVKTPSDSTGANAETGYKCYNSPAPATSFPKSSDWVSYDTMKKTWAKLGQTWCASGKFNTDAQTQAIFAAIDKVAPAAQVDKRVVLASIIQESSGCVHVASTSTGVNNPGLMQTHNGVSFIGDNASEADQAANILQMVSDGVQGTYYKSGGGDGTVQLLDKYGDFFTAARAYNSGDGAVNKSDLDSAGAGTPSYCSDTANYLMGWAGDVSQKSSCKF